MHTDKQQLFTRRSFVASLSSLLIAKIDAPARAADDQRCFAYVGSISAPKAVLPDSQVGAGKGIYQFEVNLTSGALTYRAVTPNAANPWWIAIHPGSRFLYSANEISPTPGDTSGSISAYAIDPASGALTHLNTISSGGSRPAQLSVHPSGKYVLVANFGGNALGVFPVKADGSLGTPTDMKHDQGAIGPAASSSAPPGGSQANGHDRPRPHMIQSDPAGRFVVSADLSLDTLQVWNFDVSSGILTPTAQPPVNVGPGDGARHFAFRPDGSMLFSLQEEGGTLVSFDYNAATGALMKRQRLSTLPEGFAGTFYSSEIVVAPGGAYVYTANRAYDSIVCFSIGRNGTLTKVDEVWSHGSWPRHLAFSPDGRFMYVCNQRNDEIATFAVTPSTGLLHFTGQFTSVGTPAILVFPPSKS